MVALQKETDFNPIGQSRNDRGRSSKARFRVYGEELIEKKVKSSGNSGRVYLPFDWVGKHVKIIRID